MIDWLRQKPSAVATVALLPEVARAVPDVPAPVAPPRRLADPRKRLQKAAKLKPEDVHAFVSSLFAEDLHARRVLSLASGVLGVMHSASLAIHAIGQGLAQAQGLAPKHATKQIDRLLKNRGIDLDDLLPLWVGFVLAERKDILVTLDWTDFDADDHASLSLNLVTSHGRATPLLWKTVVKSKLEGERNDHEDALLDRFHDMLPAGVHVTLLADRGFGDQKLYAALSEWGFDFVIRFRGRILVTFPNGDRSTASQLVPANGRPKLYKDVAVTADCTPVGGVVCVHARGMKDAWHLATSRRDMTAAQLVKFYGRRFTTEAEVSPQTEPLSRGPGRAIS